MVLRGIGDVIKAPRGGAGGSARSARGAGVGTWLGIAYPFGIANVIKAPHREWVGGSERQRAGGGGGDWDIGGAV